MIVHLDMTVTLDLPDGSASMDDTGGRGWVLPDGRWVKPFAVLELNDERDLTYDEALGMGIDVTDVITEVEIVA